MIIVYLAWALTPQADWSTVAAHARAGGAVRLVVRGLRPAQATTADVELIGPAGRVRIGSVAFYPAGRAADFVLNGGPALRTWKASPFDRISVCEIGPGGRPGPALEYRSVQVEALGK